MILRNGAELHRSGGYLHCEHRDWIPGIRVGEAGHHGATCSVISRYVLSWYGAISGSQLSKRLCSYHGGKVLEASRR